VVFESEAAAKTALLLTNALIIDRTIVVLAYSPPSDSPHSSDSSCTTTDDQILNPNNISAENRTKTSVIASLIAAGYKLSNEAIAKARQFDEQRHISEKVCHAAEVVVDRMKEVDRQYKISEKVERIVANAKHVDSRFRISEKATFVTISLGENWQNFQKKARANSILDQVLKWGEDLGNRVRAEIEDISQQSRTLIEQQQNKQAANSEAERLFATPVTSTSNLQEGDGVKTKCHKEDRRDIVSPTTRTTRTTSSN